MPKKKKNCQPSSCILAPNPAPLTHENSKQRIKKNQDNVTLRLLMSIHPFDDNDNEIHFLACNMDIQKEAHEKIVFSRQSFEKPYAWKRHFQGFNVKVAQELTYGMCIEDLIARKRLNVADFAPMVAPYVPGIILVLVNAIETHCVRERFWAWMLCEWQQYHQEAVDLVGHLLFVHNKVPFLQRVISRLNPYLQVRALRVFLSAFSVKMIHFFKRDLDEIIRRPLYDQFIRPNSKLRLIVQHALLPYSRTTIDTAAFLMLHLQHFLVMYPTSSIERALMAKIYGPLLISFSERPIAVNKNSTFVSEEASLLETILEVCNGSFWNHIGMLRINSAFENMERFMEKLPDLKTSVLIESDIYQEDFRIRDFVSPSSVKDDVDQCELKG